VFGFALEQPQTSQIDINGNLLLINSLHGQYTNLCQLLFLVVMYILEFKTARPK